MPHDIATIKSSYPLPAYNFRVRVGTETVRFSQVSGLALQYDTAKYRHGLSWWEGEEDILGLRQEVTFSLQRGIVPRDSRLLEWIYQLPEWGVLHEDIIIDLCDEEGVPVVSWTAVNAYPTKLQAPAFDANSNDVAIETLEMKAHNLRIEFH